MKYEKDVGKDIFLRSFLRVFLRFRSYTRKCFKQQEMTNMQQIKYKDFTLTFLINQYNIKT